MAYNLLASWGKAAGGGEETAILAGFQSINSALFGYLSCELELVQPALTDHYYGMRNETLLIRVLRCPLAASAALSNRAGRGR